MKFEKNYIRTQLMQLGCTDEESPITFTDRYKYTESKDYITLTTIRIYKRDMGVNGILKLPPFTLQMAK